VVQVAKDYEAALKNPMEKPQAGPVPGRVGRILVASPPFGFFLDFQAGGVVGARDLEIKYTYAPKA
jgi:hypothetical protein